MTKQELDILLGVIKENNSVYVYKKYSEDITKIMYISYMSKNCIFLDLQVDEGKYLINEENLIQWLKDYNLRNFTIIDNIIICK